MKFKKLTIVIFVAILLLALNMNLSAQSRPIRTVEFIAPAALITLGSVVAFTPWGQGLNAEIKGWFERDDFAQLRFDDYMQFLPAASVFALNMCGVKGRHNYRDLAMITAISGLIMLGSVHAVKTLTEVWRPDGSAPNSFPSGHTAMAFVGAEILFQEYKRRSPLIAILGYTVASGVGVMRMYNNRHWLGDVIAGAGVGILSTKLTYLIYPHIRKWLFEGKKRERKIRKSSTKHDTHTAIMPFYNGQQFGVGVSMRF